MRIIFIGTYPPEKCGIGTFTYNLRNAIEEVTVGNENYSTSVVAISSNPSEYDYPDEVKFVVDKNNLKNYEEAANYVNRNADIFFIQHEFGIFGGDNGIFILSLLAKLKVPMVVTFHTILNKPTKGQRLVMSAISKRASKIFVMSNMAVDFLEHIYKVDSDKIAKIEHGVPVFDLLSRDQLRRLTGFDGKRVMLTFGLLSRNKGLEVAIKALPRVVKEFPDVLYVILGKTHPNVVKESGEEYRKYLKLLAKKLGVENNVVFDDRYVTDRELIEMLTACDIYVTPYLNEEQITSGTLSYAIGVGAIVVSTPYWHAKELLSDNRGVLFPFNDSEKLADELINLFENPALAESIHDAAATYGMLLAWPKIAQKHLAYFEKIYEKNIPQFPKDFMTIDISVMPKFNFKHLRKLTNDTGIFQHAKYDIPNLREGYCIDDNSRALIMLVMAHKYIKDNELNAFLTKYLSFVHYMQKSDGSFHNMLKYNFEYIPEKDSEDAFGRTLWALGLLAGQDRDLKGHGKLAKELFLDALPVIDSLQSIRGKANVLIALSLYASIDEKKHGTVIGQVNKIAGDMVAEFNAHNSGNWHWFEDFLTYDNGILPLSLLYAHDVTNNKKYYEVARKSMHFLEKQTLADGIYVPVGNEEWLFKNKTKSEYDQQPLEAMSMIMSYLMLYRINNNKEYLNNLFKTYLWFLGNNTQQKSLYIPSSGACYDGLTPNGVNENQGAESLLAYWISYFTVLDAYYLQFE